MKLQASHNSAPAVIAHGAAHPTRRVFKQIPYLGPILFIYAALLVAPYVLLLRMSFNRYSSTKLYIQDYTLSNYISVLTDPVYIKLIIGTLWIGFLVTVLTLVMGLALAIVITRCKSFLKSLLMAIVLSPLLINIVVRTYAWLVLLGEKGAINSWLLEWGAVSAPLQLNNNLFGVVIGLAHITLPLMVLSLVSVIETIPPSNLEAAESLGATATRIFFRVFLPTIGPGMASGSLLVFCYTISAFITPQILGGGKVPTLATVIYDKFSFGLNWPVGSTLVFVLLSVNVLAMIIHARVFRVS